MKRKFIVRQTANVEIHHSGDPDRTKTWITWDIMKKIPDGEEFVAEFSECFGFLAKKAAKALNRND